MSTRGSNYVIDDLAEDLIHLKKKIVGRADAASCGWRTESPRQGTELLRRAESGDPFPGGRAREAGPGVDPLSLLLPASVEGPEAPQLNPLPGDEPRPERPEDRLNNCPGLTAVQGRTGFQNRSELSPSHGASGARTARRRSSRLRRPFQTFSNRV